MPQTPLINGVAHSWANINLILFGNPVIGITAIEWNRKQNKANNYGAGQLPISRGYGNIESNGSIELYYDTWKSIIDASPDKDPLKIPFFDIPIVFGGTGIQPTSIVLRACEFMEANISMVQNDTKVTVKIPLIIADIENK